MLFAEDLRLGQIVRLTTPYFDARRGIYRVVFIYRNGWLGVVSQSDGRRFDVPAHVCRQVAMGQALHPPSASPIAPKEERGSLIDAKKAARSS